MIIKDISQIDQMAEQVFSHGPNMIAVDLNDYNEFKSNSTALHAITVSLPALIKAGIPLFAEAIKNFSKEGVHQILLQISGVSSSLEVHYITINEMNIVLKTLEEHFGKVKVIWGLSDRRSDDKSDYEVVIIVGYK